MPRTRVVAVKAGKTLGRSVSIPALAALTLLIAPDRYHASGTASASAKSPPSASASPPAASMVVPMLPMLPMLPVFELPLPHELTANGPSSADPRDLRDVFADGSVLGVAGLPLPTAAMTSTAGPMRWAALALDGRVETAFRGVEDPAGKPWELRVALRTPKHLSLLRAQFGDSVTSGVPTKLHWDAIAPDATTKTCPEPHDGRDELYRPIPLAEDQLWKAPQPTRRSWFVDVDACALRLVIEETNSGPPVVRELQAIEGASNVLAGAQAKSDGDHPGGEAYGVALGGQATDAIDGSYERAWVGTPGKGAWSLTFALPTTAANTPIAIDRVRVVLGLDATSVPRDGGDEGKAKSGRNTVGRDYAVIAMPVRHRLEGSEDGVHFSLLSTGTSLPIRRRLITFPARKLRAIRLVMEGATGPLGTVESAAFPVVREVQAFAADDARPLLFAPFILAVNANPAGETHDQRGGELANDVYWAKFLQIRYASYLPQLRRDDRASRLLGPTGALLDDVPRTDAAGAALEIIEADDRNLRRELLEGSSPPPIVILSGANSWDFARLSGPDAKDRARWRWDPLRPADKGGVGGLADAVHARVAPFIGYCGGAQILALLEARGHAVEIGKRTWFTGWDDVALIDAILRRTTGRPIRGFAPDWAVLRSWPGDGRPRAEVVFDPDDPLFHDVSGVGRRRSTHAFPEWHSDVVRPSAFLPGAPLSAFALVATSVFCAKEVVDAGPHDTSFPDPAGSGRCITVAEVFRSKGPGYPIVGSQFHAEQYDFPAAASGDPPESTADARLFVAAELEGIVDAYVAHAR